MLVQIYAGHNMLVELPICLEKYSAATAALIKSVSIILYLVYNNFY